LITIFIQQNNNKGAKEMTNSRLFVFLTILLILQPLVTPAMTVAQTQEPILILFDENHGQLYNSSVYTQAIAAIQESNNLYQVKFNRGQLNKTTLIGVDLLISTNPRKAFEAEEQYAIAKWIEKGNKGFFMLSNPHDENNRSRSGRGDLFNNLMRSTLLEDALGELDPRTSLNFDENRLIKPETTIKKESFEIDTYYENETTILQTPDSKVNSIYYTGASVNAKLKIIQTGSRVYGIDKNKNPMLLTENPTVLGTTSTENNVRFMLCGSSIMFSDEKTEQGTTWFESNDNEKLWKNIIQWLTFSESIIEINTEIPDQLIYTMGSFIVGSILLIPIGWYIYNKGSKESINKVKKQPERKQEEGEKEKPKEKSKRRKRLEQRLRSEKNNK